MTAPKDGEGGFAALRIFESDPGEPAVIALLERHLSHCRAASPPEFVFALDLDGLRTPEITFWTAWEGQVLLGCGALKEFQPGHGEIKSMHTAQEARGKGVAKALVEVILETARARNYERLSLETGTMVEFAAARRLYEGFGFTPCPIFGDYVKSEYSVCYTLLL
ncbi:MAG: GNAT family N-acetyltransferase [Alphaproteobacteria bacterium]|nr:GNAT family N-acetyltransferase [Alphaproteobacteria bacterium]